MVISLLYIALQRLLELFALRRKAEADKELEIVVLRHQLVVLRRQVKRPVFRPADRAFMAAASPGPLPQFSPTPCLPESVEERRADREYRSVDCSAGS
jgi:hypothetical protein